MVLRCRELAGVASLGMKCISQRGFPCGLRHAFPLLPEWTVIRRLLGPANQALEGEFRPSPLRQLRKLRAGPALPPRSTGWSLAFGVGGTWAWVRVLESRQLLAALGLGESS